jgi:hypothetical protein
MGAIVWASAWWLAPWLSAGALPVRLLTLAALVVGGAAFFAAFCQLTGTVDFRRLPLSGKPGATAGP